jgi:hypothetical protein
MNATNQTHTAELGPPPPWLGTVDRSLRSCSISDLLYIWLKQTRVSAVHGHDGGEQALTAVHFDAVRLIVSSDNNPW